MERVMREVVRNLVAMAVVNHDEHIAVIGDTCGMLGGGGLMSM